jgi:hypothetical protein
MSSAQLEALQRELAALQMTSATAIAAAEARAEAAEAAAVRARAEAAEARAGAQRAAAAVAAAAAAGAAAAAPAVPALRTPLPSPTKGGATTLLADTDYWGFAAAPVSFDAGGSPRSFAPAMAAARDAHRRAILEGGRRAPRSVASCLMWEDVYFRPATSALPAHVVVGAARVKALKLFGPGALRTSRWTFDLTCQPELPTAPRDLAQLRPVFQGEVKSVDNDMLGQALYYTLMGMAASFFPPPPDAAPAAPQDAAAPGRRVYYASPPLGFALLAFPHVGYFAAVEMAGKVLVSPASRPFFLGSDEHRAAAAALPIASIGPPAWEYDTTAPWRSDEPPLPPPLPGAGAAALPSPPVAWAVCPDGRFRKLVRADARSADEWVEMCEAYAVLAPLLRVAEEAPALPPLPPPPPPPPPPPALVRGARLLFGAHEALVEMAAVAGARAASDEEATGAALGEAAVAIVAAVATAVAWLAAHRVLYTDLRGPNVLVLAAEGAEGGVGAVGAAAAAGGGARAAASAWLVDYDDCVVVAEPVRTTAAFRAALGRVAEQRAARRGGEQRAATARGRGFAERFAAGEFQALAAALDAAFAALP